MSTWMRWKTKTPSTASSMLKSRRASRPSVDSRSNPADLHPSTTSAATSHPSSALAKIGLQVETDVIALPNVDRSHLKEKLRFHRSHLENSISNLREKKSSIQESLRNAWNVVDRSEQDIHRLKTASEAAGKLYEEIQSLRDYVGDLSMCLKAKLPIVEEMEDVVHKQEHALGTAEFDRRLNRLDEACLQATSDIIMDALKKGEKLEGMDELEVSIPDASPEDLDAVRKRREAAMKVAVEGYVHEMPGIHWEPLETKEIEAAVDDVFSDALPEFKSISVVVDRLYSVKTKHPELYTRASIAVSLSELLSLFVRLEVLTWRPLRGTPLELDNMSWYRTLENFGDREEECLIPDLVRSVCLPTVGKHVEACWSPFDSRRTQIVVEMLREMLVYVPMEEEAMQKLLKCTVRRLEGSIASSGMASIASAVFGASSVVRSILEVQFQNVLRLIDCVLKFDGVLPDGVVRRLVMRQLVIDTCLPYLMAMEDKEGSLQKVVVMMSRIPTSISSADRTEAEEVVNVLKRIRRRKEKRNLSVDDERSLEQLSSIIEQLELDCQ